MSAMLAETRSDEATVVVKAPRQQRKRVVIVGAGLCRNRRGARCGTLMSMSS